MIRLISGMPQTQSSATARTLSNKRTANSLPPLASAVSAHAKTIRRICTSCSFNTPGEEAVVVPVYSTCTCCSKTPRSNTGYIIPISSSYTRQRRIASVRSIAHSGSTASRTGGYDGYGGDGMGDGSCVRSPSASLSRSWSPPPTMPRCCRLVLARSKLNAEVVGPVKVNSLTDEKRLGHACVCVCVCVCACVGTLV